MTTGDASQLPRLTVLGAGAMGHGIAQVAATAGYKATLYDLESRFLDAAMEKVGASLNRLKERGRLDDAALNEALSRIRTSTDLAEATRGSGLIIEAITERIEAKQRIYEALDSVVAADVIVASNTSTIPISQLAQSLSHPDRFVGIHFFNPPQVMKLVEITRGDGTSDQTLSFAVDFVGKLDKEPIICQKDLPGFIVNRILGALLNEAALMHQQDEATIAAIDSAARFRLNLPMGLFELADYIGLDVMRSLVQILADNAALPAQATSWQEHVDRGDLGAKSGRGFHPWDPRPVIEDGVGDDVDVVRLLAPSINSAAQLVEVGAASMEDVNKAVQLGLGFPHGIFTWTEAFGIDAIITVLKDLESRHGPWYAPCQLLLEAAAGRETLKG